MRGFADWVYLCAVGSLVCFGRRKFMVVMTPKSKKKSLLYTVLGFKCPRCQVGDLYYTPTFSFRRSFDMPDNCPNCGQKYSLEPGFYYGAMFISYLLTAFLMFSMFALFKFGLQLDIQTSFGIGMAMILLLYVYIFRLSRSIWLHFFVRSEVR
jgi:uncharacterized protein (DUF983 family)